MTIDNLLSKDSIMRQYEQTRLNNRQLMQQRQDEIYRLYPRIREIEETVAAKRFELIRKRIRRDADSEGLTQALKTETKTLFAERDAILADAGYPADYLDEIYTCPICEDTGYADGHRCECFNKKLIDNLYQQSNLKNILAKENFNTFNTAYYSKEAVKGRPFTPYENICSVLDKLHLYIERFEKHFSETDVAEKKARNLKPNLLFYGETGLGKTFLTNCVAKELLDRGHSVLYLSANDLFENLIGKYVMNNATELEDLYKLVYNCELLIIDDLGTELTNNFVRSQLFEVINQRSLSGVSTVISTNLDMELLNEAYSQRVVSRLIENYTIFNIYGKNIRYEKRKNSIL
jgi:DNA replication protein DnaC